MSKAEFIMAVCMMLFMASCHHKDIVCPGSEEYQVNVAFEWDRASGASPEGMTLYFYSDNGECRKFDIAGKNGGPVQLPAGSYSMVAYNNDLPSVVISDTHLFHSIKAEARRVKEKDYLAYAGMLYESTIDRIEVTPCGVNYVTADGTEKNCRRGVVRSHPDSITSIYTVIFKNVSGISGVKNAYATIKGVAEGQYLCDHQFFGMPSESYFPLTVERAKDSLSGVAGLFSSLSGDRTYSLSAVVTLSDGTSYVKELDITRQVLNSKYPHNVLIIIDGLKIPDTGSSSPPVGGDIEVDVEGWKIIEIDLNTDSFRY